VGPPVLEPVFGGNPGRHGHIDWRCWNHPGAQFPVVTWHRTSWSVRRYSAQVKSLVLCNSFVSRSLPKRWLLGTHQGAERQAPGLLPERVHVQVQPAQVAKSGRAVFPAGPTSRSCGTSNFGPSGRLEILHQGERPHGPASFNWHGFQRFNSTGWVSCSVTFVRVCI
jgi:hypothetical protein